MNDYSSVAADPHRLAADYHGAGFRECAAEVARYLVSVEGMDSQDPVRVRLMSHLQMFASSRAAAAAYHQHQPSQPPPPPPPPPQPQPHHHAWSSYASPSVPVSCSYDSSKAPPDASAAVAAAALDPLAGYFINNVPPPPPAAVPPPPPPPPPATTATNSSGHHPPSPQNRSREEAQSTVSPPPPPPPAASSSYASSPVTANPYYASNITFGNIPPLPTSVYGGGTTNTNSKPYRPWGAEMAC